MVCDNCKEREAVIAVTSAGEGGVVQLHLCERCAAERGIETTLASSAKHPLGEFLEAVQHQMPPSADTARCSFCGMTLADFRTTNRWGCARCYAQFEGGIRELLRRVHGNSRHVGRGYHPPEGEAPERASVLGELRERLRRAIESEQFETAASLRDRIRSME